MLTIPTAAKFPSNTKERHMNQPIVDVGPQNPELRNSPIAWEYLDEEEWQGTAVEEQPACYFNDSVFTDGDLVRSDEVVLECRQGIWVPVGTGDPENP
jgi:hypothetical protein